MAGDMTQDAVDCAAEAVAQFTAHTDVARFIKIEFDHKYGAPWHVIVGHHFASYISFEPQISPTLRPRGSPATHDEALTGFPTRYTPFPPLDFVRFRKSQWPSELAGSCFSARAPSFSCGTLTMIHP